MGTKEIRIGRIPMPFIGGTNKPIEKITPVNPVNNNKKPNPEWQPKNKEPGKGKIIDTRA